MPAPPLTNLADLAQALQWTHPWAALIASAPLGGMAWQRWRPGAPARIAGQYADPHLHPWALRWTGEPRRAWRAAARVLMWLFLGAALAGPRLPMQRGPMNLPVWHHALPVMVLLQMPAGSETRSSSPDELETARMGLQDLQARLHGERLGLLLWRDSAGLLLPCTDDATLFESFVQRASPALLPPGSGPGLAGALALARAQLATEPGPRRALLVVGAADGATLDAAQRDAVLRQAALLRQARLPVFVWLRAPDAPDAALLRELAARTGGAISAAPDPWGALYTRGLALVPGNPARAPSQAGWRELYPFPLAGAMFLAMLLELGGVAWRRRSGVSAALVLVFAAGGVAVGTRSAHASALTLARPGQASQAWQAWRAWQAGSYPKALALYAALPGFSARLGEGDCAYRLGDWVRARAAFSRALLDADTDAQRAQALYNLGNAEFHIAGGLRAALDAFDGSLRLQPGNARALRNLHLAQAQWDEEHPEQAQSAMRKRAPALHHAVEPDTGDLRPSLGASSPASRGQVGVADQRLGAGKLSGGAAAAPQVSPQQELQGAQRLAPLVPDAADQLLAGLIARDNLRLQRAAEPAR